jgi:SnoaL-like domain
MRERNVERARRLVAAFNARDIEAMIRCSDPSIEFDSAFGVAVGGDVLRGHDGLRRWHRAVEDTWGEEIRLEPEAYFELDERTLTRFTLHGRGQRSGAEVAMPIALVASWRNGLVVFMKGYIRMEDALRDLGVSEDELEPSDP